MTNTRNWRTTARNAWYWYLYWSGGAVLTILTGGLAAPVLVYLAMRERRLRREREARQITAQRRPR